MCSKQTKFSFLLVWEQGEGILSCRKIVLKYSKLQRHGWIWQRHTWEAKQANIRDMAGTKVDKSQFVYMSKDVPNHESTITNRIRKQQLKLLFPNQNSDKRV